MKMTIKDALESVVIAVFIGMLYIKYKLSRLFKTKYN
jgi:hypothetical protein